MNSYPRSRSIKDFKFREEEGGIWSVYPHSRIDRQVHFLNRIAVKIFRYCNGKNSVDDIVSLIQAEFSDISSSRLKRDVQECLFSLRGLGLISYEEPLDQSRRGLIIRVAEEKDFKAISSFIIKSLKIKKKEERFYVFYFPVNYKTYYSPISIRMRQFYNKEIYCLAKKNGELLGVASVTSMAPPLKSAQLGIFAVRRRDGEEENKVSVELLTGITKVLRKFGLMKLKCGLVSGSEDGQFLEFLSQNRFQLEARLKDELGKDKDILIYTLFL